MTLVTCGAWLVAVAALELGLSADPALPAPNLLQNPGIEEAQDGRPASWSWSTAVPENFEAGRVAPGRDGGHCLWVKAKSGVMSGYWSQSVAVEPGVAYRLTGWFRLAGGRLLTYVHARTSTVSLDERFYAQSLANIPLVPVFLKPEYVAGARPDQWYPLALDFAPPEGMTAVAVSVGMYFTGGEVWYDDLVLARATTRLTASARGDEDLKRAVLVAKGSDEPVWDSGDLPAGTRALEQVIEAAPTDATYVLRVTTAAGRVVERACPGGEE